MLATAGDDGITVGLGGGRVMMDARRVVELNDKRHKANVLIPPEDGLAEAGAKDFCNVCVCCPQRVCWTGRLCPLLADGGLLWPSVFS